MISFIPSIATVIHIGDRLGAFAQLKLEKGVPVIQALAQIEPDEPLPPPKQPELRHVRITEALRNLNGAANGEEAVLLNRQRDAKGYVTWLPSSDDAEIEQMARFEISKVAPLDAEDFEAEHINLKQENDGARCLLYALDTVALESGVRGALHAQMPLSRASVGSWGLYHAWHYAQQHGILPALPDDPTKSEGEKARVGRTELVINLGIDALDFLFIKDGLPVLIRSSSNGLNKLLVNLRRGGLPISLADFEKIDFERIDFTILALQDQKQTAPNSAAGKNGGGMRALQMDSMPSVEMRALQDGKTLEEMEKEEADSGKRPIMTASASANGGGMAAGGDVSMWGGGPGDILQTWHKRLIRELRQTFLYLQTENIASGVDRITLAGPGSGFTGLGKRLGAELEVPVVHLDGLLKFQAGKPKKGQPLVLPTSAAERGLYVEAIGEALIELGAAAEPNAKLDFLPSWYLDRRAAGDRRRSFITAGALAAIAIVLLVVFLQLRQGFREQYVAAIQAENERIEPLAEDAADMRKKLEIVEKHVDQSYSAIAVLDLIGEQPAVSQKRVRLTQFNFERGEEVFIRGHAKQLSDYHDFEIGLRRSGFFVYVETKSTDPTRLSGDRNVLQFSLVAKLDSELSLSTGSGGGFGSSYRASSGSGGVFGQ